MMGDFATQLQDYNRWKTEVHTRPEDYEAWLELTEKAELWDAARALLDVSNEDQDQYDRDVSAGLRGLSFG